MVIETLSYLLPSRLQTFPLLYRSIVFMLYGTASLTHQSSKILGCNVSFWLHSPRALQNRHQLHFGLEMISDFPHSCFDLFDLVEFCFANAWLVQMFFEVVVIVHFVVVV